MNKRIHQTRLFASLAGLISMLTLSSAFAQTYTWDQWALGQEYQHCPDLYPEYWPSNNAWSQSVATNGGCSGGIVISAPSNWDPWLPIGVYPGGPGAVGVNVILDGLVGGTNGPGEGNTSVDGGTRVTVNCLTIQTNGSLNIGYLSWVTATNVDIQRDTIIGAGSYAGTMFIAAGGTLTKSGGTNTLSFGQDGYGNAVGLEAVNASLVVQSGTFAMPYNLAGAWYGGTFSISNNANVVLNVDSGADPVLTDTITGVGGGTVLMTGNVRASGYDFYDNYHNGLTLSFPSNMFQWSGGNFTYASVTNMGVLNLTNAPGLQTPLFNNGTMYLADNSSFGLSAGGGNNVYNNAGGIFNILGNSSITDGGHTIVNSGLFLKSGGTGAAQIFAIFKDYGGTVEADTGTLALNLSGAGYFTNTTFRVRSGATLTLLTSNYDMEVEGTLTGSGGGTILMNNGTVHSSYANATLNFPGAMFQWAGGNLGGESYNCCNPILNIGTVNVSGPVAIDGSIANNGAMIQSGAGGIGAGYALYNNAGGVYDIQNDNGISLGNIYNYGLLKKSAGSGTSVIAANLYCYGPISSLEVDSGVLALANGNYFTNASFVANNGATLDLFTANATTEIEGSFAGSGGGTVLMTNGTVFSNHGATMSFPGPMFQWAGGKIGNSSATITNAGILNITGPVAMNSYGYFANNGTMIQSGAGAVGVGVGLNNNAGGVYDIQNDNGESLNNFNNYGLLEKTAGSGTSVIAGNFSNYGAVQAPSGTLLFSGEFDQYAGTLQITPAILFGQDVYLLGGTVTGTGSFGGSTGRYVYCKGGVLAPGNPFGALNIPAYETIMYSSAVLNIVLGGPSQFSQLAVQNYIQYGGTLNVTIANGYAPAIGTQFQIITNGSSGYGFASVNVPQGISVNYSNSGVFLVVTGTVPVGIANSQKSGTNFTFSFGTINGRSYIVQQKTNLAATNWVSYTNFIGDGSLYQFVAPITAMPGSFFRVLEP